MLLERFWNASPAGLQWRSVQRQDGGARNRSRRGILHYLSEGKVNSGPTVANISRSHLSLRLLPDTERWVNVSRTYLVLRQGLHRIFFAGVLRDERATVTGLNDQLERAHKFRLFEQPDLHN